MAGRVLGGWFCLELSEDYPVLDENGKEFEDVDVYLGVASITFAIVVWVFPVGGGG